jgi:hypothetical protein
MPTRIHRHIVDLAGSGLVLVGLLLATLALSAVPVVVQGLTKHPARSQPAGRSGQPGLSGAGRAP